MEKYILQHCVIQWVEGGGPRPLQENAPPL